MDIKNLIKFVSALSDQMCGLSNEEGIENNRWYINEKTNFGSIMCRLKKKRVNNS